MKISAEPLGIQDYLMRAGRTSPRDRQPQRFTVANDAVGRPSPGSKTVRAGIGLTAVDYLSQPLRSACRPPQTVTDKMARARYRAQAGAAAQPVGHPARKAAALPQTAASDAKASCRSERVSAAGDKQKIEGCLAQAAAEYRLPQALLRAVVRAESGFQVKAVSPAGAQGLMQLMPQTAKELGVEDPFDVAQNIDGGARYLRRMLDRFDGDVPRALAAYNAGPGAVERYQGVPPYTETRRYVARVMDFAGLQV
jgi:soluble lytic murein transglycosylase-like protein